MFDVVAVGELLIDFCPLVQMKMDASFFVEPWRSSGQRSCHAVQTGSQNCFIGKVGKDGFGQFLKATLDNAGIDTSNLLMSSSEMTTLAFVHLNEKGDRSLVFIESIVRMSVWTPANLIKICSEHAIFCILGLSL